MLKEDNILIVKIKCPHCNAEYLPEEIFYPDSVFNNNVKAVRDEEYKLIVVEGDSFNLEEEFECEYCGCKFKVTGKVDFKTEKIEENDFDEETTIVL